jgi:hypothetical protein
MTVSMRYGKMRMTCQQQVETSQLAHHIFIRWPRPLLSQLAHIFTSLLAAESSASPEPGGQPSAYAGQLEHPLTTRTPSAIMVPSTYQHLGAPDESVSQYRTFPC